MNLLKSRASTLVDRVNPSRTLVGDGEVNVNAAYICLRSGVLKIWVSCDGPGGVDNARFEDEFRYDPDSEGMDVDEDREWG